MLKKRNFTNKRNSLSLLLVLLITVLMVAACGGAAPADSPQQPAQAEEVMEDKDAMSEEVMAGDKEMSDAMHDDEAMADDEEMSEAMSDEAMADDEEMSDAMSDEVMADDEKMSDAMHDDEAMADDEEMSDAMSDDEAVANDEKMSDAMSDEAMADDEKMSDAMSDDEAMADGEKMSDAMHDDEAMVDGEEMSDAMSDDEAMVDKIELPAWFEAELTNVNTGEPFKIGDFNNKVVLVETMAVWCSNCLRQQQEVKTLHGLLGDQPDLVSVALDIDPNETNDILKIHTDKNDFDWVYAVASPEVSRDISQLYGGQFLNPPATPMLIIDRHGQAHPLPFGHKTAQSLQEALAPFLSESGKG